MAKAVFRPYEITPVNDKVLLKLSREFEEEVPEVVSEDVMEYTGPTADDLRREADHFREQWNVEKQRMLDEAKAEADKIVAEADSAAFEQIKTKTNDAQIIKQNAQTAADELIQDAKKNADQIIAEAEQQKLRTLTEAQNQGFEKGHEDGYKKGEAEVQRLITRLHTVVEKTMDRRQEILIETEQQIVDLVLLMARKVIKVLSENQRSVVMQNVVQALRKVKGRGDVIVHVNTADLALTSEHTRDFLSAVESVKNISVVEDSTVDRGGCIIETDFGSIDARISSQLAELEQKILEVSPIRTTVKTAAIQQDS